MRECHWQPLFYLLILRWRRHNLRSELNWSQTGANYMEASRCKKNKEPKDHYRSPEYNKYFHFKLDFWANQKPRSAQKHKLVKAHWYLASCQVSLNSVQQFSKKKSKMSQQIRGYGGHLIFPIIPKNTKLSRDHWDLASCLVSLNPFQWFQRKSKKKNVSTNQKPGRSSYFSGRPEKRNLIEDIEILLPVKFPFNGKVIRWGWRPLVI